MKAVGTGMARMVAGCVLGALAANGAWAQQQAVVDQIDAPLLQKHFASLVAGDGQNRGFTRTGGTERNPRKPLAGHDQARDYIASAFQAAGLTTVVDEFSFATSFGGPVLFYTGCNNIVATLPGTDPDTYGYYVIGAYYDTLDRGQPNPLNYSKTAMLNPGADMNASGVAALLSLAEVLGRHSFRSTLIFAAFDASQKNFSGSYEFLKTMTTPKTNSTKKIYRGDIKGMVSLDTIGFNKKGGYRNSVLLYGGNETPSRNRRRLGKAIAGFGGLDVIQGGSLQSSDHAPFAQMKIDSMVVHEGGVWVNKSLYTTNDTLSASNYIDYAYCANITKGVAAFLCERAGLVTQ